MSADDAVDAMRVWHAGKGDSGLRFWSDWLPPEEAAEVFAQVESTQLFPWDLRPTLYGERLPQHAFHYLRSDRRASEGSLPGLRALEALCGRVERDLGCGVSDVYCNRFEDPNHRIEWHQVQYCMNCLNFCLRDGHVCLLSEVMLTASSVRRAATCTCSDASHCSPSQDQYGYHIAVLSLGAQRALEFKNTKSKELRTYRPSSGELYFMSLTHNKTHKHRVCASDGQPETRGTRVSFVFFVTPPFGLKEYKLSWGDRLKGGFNSWLS